MLPGTVPEEGRVCVEVGGIAGSEQCSALLPAYAIVSLQRGAFMDARGMVGRLCQGQRFVDLSPGLRIRQVYSCTNPFIGLGSSGRSKVMGRKLQALCPAVY